MTYNPIQKVDEKLRIFRDDLFPFLGGGNKGRKMLAIGDAILQQGAGAIVTTGGIQSNHCRAAAVFAAQYKLKCSLVLHGSSEDFARESGNAKIMRMSGARIVFATAPDLIGGLMNAEMQRFKEEALNPFYIWGGGHTMEGGHAYIKAIAELKQYCETNSWYPELIFLASGTGSTQSGIMAGLDKYGFENTEVIGISVARKSTPATEVVSSFYLKLCNHYNIDTSNRKTNVVDDYLCGGYEQYNEELKMISDTAIFNYGFVLDTTYAGKGFYGMKQYIKENSFLEKNILFWHTGGVLNFLAR